MTTIELFIAAIALCVIVGLMGLAFAGQRPVPRKTVERYVAAHGGREPRR